MVDLLNDGVCSINNNNLNNLNNLPSPEECERILGLSVGDARQRHCRAVAKLARRIALALLQAGHCLDTELIFVAGMLHDVAKGQPDHAALGAKMIAGLGYPQVAEIIAQHMDITLSGPEVVNAAEVVYLADKLTEGDRVVGLKRRFEMLAERYPYDYKAQASIKARLTKAGLIQKKIEGILGTSIDSCWQE
ncbi:MAG TPA: HD domain-containing protein [Methylomusa anaerophila]|uniref:Putative nicotinate-nucleotide adenylyltransferase n=1 Tax=Methylomusa anaerophila TaxID=1930071 RepID=A0A348AJM8_9FIRM|nr:HD domain-containing protein [Methylomusa anaerophila]BBB91276.1 putative nicotinate-nucleotide adenylyltransferase [Methylomusa anaerophila]HML89729.1 HD domain-containing protein [Methylomusa anaerophila]